MQADPNFYFYAAVTVISGIVWAVRLEGRVNKSDQRVNDLKEDVEYIRRRIDEALDR
jgi:hypothetical protein